MLQATNTGVEGSMTALRANTPRHAFSRLEAIVLVADPGRMRGPVRKAAAG